MAIDIIRKNLGVILMFVLGFWAEPTFQSVGMLVGGYLIGVIQWMGADV